MHRNRIAGSSATAPLEPDAGLASLVFESLPQALLLLDHGLRVTGCNKALRRVAGLAPDDDPEGWPALPWLARLAKRGHPVATGLRASLRAPPAVPRSLGERAPFRTDDGRHLAWSVRDLGERGFLLAIEEVPAADGAVPPHRCAVTSLPDRRSFLAALERAVAKGPVALLCFDLDRFKLVNDTYGHAFGDALLRVVVERTLKVTRRDDAVSRLSADGFAVLMEGDDPLKAAQGLAERLADSLSRPYLIDDHAIKVRVSSGLAASPRDATEAVELLRRANLALRKAKISGGGGHRWFEG